MSWDIIYARHAQKDAQKLAASGLKNKAQALLAIIKEDPFQRVTSMQRSEIEGS